MAIQLNAQKGGFSITQGYLIVTETTMRKYLKPVTVERQVTQPDNTIITVQEPGVVNALMSTARVQVYPTKEARDTEFGAADMNAVFSFEHVDGKDPVQEAYAYVKVNGLRGWVLSDMVDA